MPPKAKKIFNKTMPYVPPILISKADKVIKSGIEKLPKRTQGTVKDELRRVGGMPVK